MDLSNIFTLIDKYGVTSSTIILVILYTLAMIIIQIIKNKNNICKHDVVPSQLRVYRDRVNIYKTLALKNYAEDLDEAIENGNIVISSDEYQNLMIRMRELIGASFYDAENYFRSLIYNNHIPDPETSDFSEYCVEKYGAHQNIIWNYYEANYNKKFFKLELNQRRKKFEEKNNQAFSDFCAMMERLYDLTNKRN